MERAQGFAQQGSQTVWTAGHPSATLVQDSAPYATITVYLTGTTILATLYSDNQTPPTVMGNPFTANSNGYWFFYAQDGRYDVMMTADNWEWTIGDIQLGDAGSVYNWIQNIQANGNSLLGASLVQTGCLELSGAAMNICSEPGTGIIFYDPGGNSIATLDPTGKLTLSGCVDAQCFLLNGQNLVDSSGNLSAPGLNLDNGSCQMSIAFDANCDLQFKDASGNPVAWITQTGGLGVLGDIGSSGNLDISGNANVGGVVNTTRLNLSDGTCQMTIGGFDANCDLQFTNASGIPVALLSQAGNFDIEGGYHMQGVPILSYVAASNQLTISAPGEVVVSTPQTTISGKLSVLGCVSLPFVWCDSAGNPVAQMDTNGWLDLKGLDTPVITSQGVQVLPPPAGTTNGFVLTANSAATNGVSWQAPTATGVAQFSNFANYPGRVTPGAVYQNTTGQIMLVAVVFLIAAGAWYVRVDGNNPPQNIILGALGIGHNNLTFIVLPGQYYMLQSNNASGSNIIISWNEWY